MEIQAKKNNILVDLRKNMHWEHASSNNVSAWAIGYAFLNNKFISSMGLLKLFLIYKEIDFDAYVNLAKGLNGNFALIVKNENSIFASVDKIRSYPLFYSSSEKGLLVSDNAGFIRNKLCLNSLSQNSAEEFFASGYVSGKETLFADIKQLQAGECLYFSAKGPKMQRVPVTKRYYIYYAKTKMKLTSDALMKEYDGVLRSVFRRIVESAVNRKVVIPLSGGMDSRLVASMLRKMDYKNVLCISYGIPNNWQTRISKKAAEHLGFKWEYVPYTRKEWRNAYKSKEFKDFFYSYDNFSSIPNVDDWLAVRKLRSKGAIPEDAIFIPGHTGDFISGGHLRYVFGKKQTKITKQNLIANVLSKHYDMWKTGLKRPHIKLYLINKISKFFEHSLIISEQDMADAYECWEWQERQAKFVINSVRTYDYWGYEWRLPLWDTQMMDFWSAVPYEFKLEKRLYLLHQEKMDRFNIFGKNLRRKRLYKRSFISPFRKFYEYFTDPKGIYGIYNYFTITFLNKNRRNEHSILIRDYLKNINDGLKV